MSNKNKPQMPGDDSNTGEENPGASAAEQTISSTDQTLADMRAELAALKNQVKVMSTPRKMRNSDDDLPEAADIDRKGLKSPVLTKSGWLVPEGFGSQPNAFKV